MRDLSVLALPRGTSGVGGETELDNLRGIGWDEESRVGEYRANSTYLVGATYREAKVGRAKSCLRVCFPIQPRFLLTSSRSPIRSAYTHVA